MSWLTSANVETEAQLKVNEVKAKTNNRRSSVSQSYEHELIAKIVGSSLAAGQAIQQEWFCDSVGIVWDDEDSARETWYVCRAPVAATFTNEQIVHWTHWIGRVSTLVREYLDVHGKFPEKVAYGPPKC
jgi:hypothetical protein